MTLSSKRGNVMYRKYFIIIFLCVLFCQPMYGVELPTTSAEGVILIEAKTNTVLYEKNAYKKFYPASITKLLTALIVEEELEDNTIIKKSKDSINKVPSDSSNIGVSVGQAYTKQEGLYGLLLGSDNFIAHDLALATAGSIDSFANKMNERAKAFGATSTHFTNPHGYHDPKHYTTPYDMSQIARGVFENDKVTQIAGTAYHTFKLAGTKKSIQIKNTSRLLRKDTGYYIKEVVATKTGYHSDAKQTIVAKGIYGDMELIVVIMKTNTPSQYKDVERLLEYGKKNFAIEKAGEGYRLKNLTASPWAKSILEGFEKNKDYTIPSKPYQQAVTFGELKALVTCIGGEDYRRAMSAIGEAYDLKEASILKRVTVAKIIRDLCQQKNLIGSVEESPIVVNDIGNLSTSDQESVYYVIRTGLMGNRDSQFDPEAQVSYEEAVCIISRLGWQ